MKLDVALHVPCAAKRADPGGETKATILGKHAFEDHGPANRPGRFDLSSSDPRLQLMSACSGQHKSQLRLLLSATKNDRFVLQTETDGFTGWRCRVPGHHRQRFDETLNGPA